ncbi:4-hydroxy-tetrahydrodipicolinate reductase 2 [Populus alba x Populus x berolinensis]|nr:4-hydroxy-tetrahydrodipicolinate reductase 2 [Populus alba x Populus x berolinensis]
MWVQGAELKQQLKPPFLCNPLNSNRTRFFTKHYQKQKPFVVVMSMSTRSTAVPIMVNGCNGKMGSSVIMAANSAGLQILPKSFGPENEAGNTVEVCGNEIKIHGPSERDSVLASLYDEYPNMIVVDYTLPTLIMQICIVKLGFHLLWELLAGGDRDRLYKTVDDSKVYAVISPQMGKQVKESHQAAKLDTSATAKAVISCFKKLGVSFDDQIEMIRDPKEQKELVGVPDEYLSGHAFHFYYLSSPGKTVSLEFQHNVCGRSIYAEGTIDAVLFLAEKIQSKADKRIYNIIDILREGNK